MNIRKILVFALVSASMISCSNKPNNVRSLNTQLDSVSYALGLSMASQLKVSFDEVNSEILQQAIRNGLDSTNLLIEFKDIQAAIGPYFQEKQKKAIKERQEKAIKEAEIKFGDHKKAGEEFLKANKSKDGIITTNSGLQYMVIKEGKGAMPKATDKIKIHYHGTTIEGKVFDSTVDRKKPIESRANAFIKGFNEGLLLMKVGAKYKFFIPQELAYGPQQRSALIKPFSTLIFEVELLDILDKK